MLDEVIARCGCRFDLAGGTLDIWPLGQLHEAARTVNVAIDVKVEVALRRRTSGCVVAAGDSRHRATCWDELVSGTDTALVAHIARAVGLPPAEVRLSSASPRGGGLGASSAIGAALVAASERLMDHRARSALECAELLRDLEARLMGYPTGLQDHLPPMMGGALEIAYPPGGVTLRRLDVDLDQLADCFMVVFTGRSHFSGATNWQVVRRRLDGDSQITALFGRIGEVAAAMVPAVEGGDLERVGTLLSEEWSARRRLAEGVSTPEIECILEAATSAGAWGGKAGGAGGGGCVAIVHPSRLRQAVQDAVTQAGGTVLEARPTAEGMRVEDVVVTR